MDFTKDLAAYKKARAQRNVPQRRTTQMSPAVVAKTITSNKPVGTYQSPHWKQESLGIERGGVISQTMHLGQDRYGNVTQNMDYNTGNTGTRPVISRGRKVHGVTNSVFNATAKQQQQQIASTAEFRKQASEAVKNGQTIPEFLENRGIPQENIKTANSGWLFQDDNHRDLEDEYSQIGHTASVHGHLFRTQSGNVGGVTSARLYPVEKETTEKMWSNHDKQVALQNRQRLQKQQRAAQQQEAQRLEAQRRDQSRQSQYGYGQNQNRQPQYGYGHDQSRQSQYGYGHDQNRQPQYGHGHDQSRQSQYGYGQNQSRQSQYRHGQNQSRQSQYEYGHDQSRQSQYGYGHDQNRQPQYGHGHDQSGMKAAKNDYRGGNKKKTKSRRKTKSKRKKNKRKKKRKTRRK
jgi:hypothetical protein